MYRRCVVCGWAVLVSSTAWALAGTIDPGLEDILAVKRADEAVSTLVYLKDRVNLDVLSSQLDRERASFARRHETVVRALQDKASATQGRLLQDLDALFLSARAEYYESFWVANVLRVDAPAATIRELAEHPDVDIIYYNYDIELVRPVGDQPAAAEANANDAGQRTPEIGLVAIRAPEVWALGYTGEGMLTATLDTGVDGNHPALASRWRGLDPQYQGHPQWAWFDPVTNTTFPTSFGSHGTHTMGTVCGGAPGDQIGVAPGAKWIHAAVIDRVSIPQTVADACAAFQWLIDPDGNPSTSFDVPHVCSNSWGVTTYHGYPPCDQTFWSFIDANEAAGIVQLFSAGNEGPGASTHRRPADRATTDYNTLSVGAVDANSSSWPIASFSSRGPSNCTPDGSQAIKPEIAAPGVDVRSSVPGGGYQQWGWSGTSMASPHVNGVLVLMRQACPDMPVDQLKQILFDTAYDLGTAGNDNSYGWGMVDAYEAVMMTLDQCVPHPPTAFGAHHTTNVNTGLTITLTADDDGKPDPPAALTYVIVSLPAYGHLADANTATAILSVPYTLSGHGSQVYYQPNAYFVGEDNFGFVANDGGTPPEGGDSNVANIRITIQGVPELVYSFPLDTDPGWTTQGLWAFGQPTGGGSHGLDPVSGYTGNFVYGYNLFGDYSNNMPAYYLTTTPIDCSRVGGAQLRFYRWLGVEAFDMASVEVSNNGTNWVSLWQSYGSNVNETSWTLRTYNIATIVDGQPTVYIRWGMGPSDHSVTYPGWNIDDIQIWGLATPEWVLGDLNCDGVADFGDINAFVLRLSNPLTYWTTFPGCADSNGDINGDGVVNFSDINPFVALLAGS